MRYFCLPALLCCIVSVSGAGPSSRGMDKEGANWEKTTVYLAPEQAFAHSRTIAQMLVEEAGKRTGFRWNITASWPEEGNVILLVTAPSGEAPAPADYLPGATFPGSDPLPPLSTVPESYRIAGKAVQGAEGRKRKVILIEGRDERGLLFGAGRLLRLMQFSEGSVDLALPLAVSASPEAAIRGHQLGYRHTANSYDGWTPEQYEQYIRELAVFGVNSIEVIPFDTESPHFTLPPREMNVRISAICEKYGLDLWMWSPVDFDLNDSDKTEAHLAALGGLFADLPRLDHLFVPGGDPGDNHPELVMPYLETLSGMLANYHPEAKIWLSLQGFTPEMSRYVYRYIREEAPEWLGGLVAGPGSPPLAETRRELPPQYGLRHYPDITHTVRCQYPVPWWDPAFNFTLGREPVNPRPRFYSEIYRESAPFTNGFITYSDGVHDDVNKVVWSLLGWDAALDEREMLQQYASFFFGASIAREAAGALLALEQNWKGPIAENTGIDSCLRTWTRLANTHPALSGSWRWQLHLMRAYYDAYTRHRAIYEQGLEEQVNQVLQKASVTGPAEALKKARAILERADKPVKPEWRRQIIFLCERLFESVCLQTSVEKYGAKNPERGAVLDFLDRPLNNRWWLEDEFRRIDSLGERRQVQELEIIGRWEHPGEGSFYDDVGNISQSPHVLRSPGSDIPGFDWWESGYSRERLSWMVSMRWPEEMNYRNLDPEATYIVRATGYGECLLRADGQRLTPTRYGKGVGELKEFPVPQELLRDGRLRLTWDSIDEEHLNWRQHSRLNEVWLILMNDHGF